MPRQYDTQGYTDDPLAQGNSSSYQWNGFAGLIDDIFGGFIFGDYDWSSYIMGELLGHNSQQREFEQQEYLMKYDDPVYKMARAKEAGINLNLAAQQIAGSGNSVSAPAVASNTQGVANGLNAISGLANAVTGGKASLAEAAFKEGTLKPTIDKIENEASLAFQNVGLTAAQRQAAENYLKYMDEDQFTDLQIKRVNFHRFNQEYKNAKALHNNILAEYDAIIARKDLDISQKEYTDALTAKIDEETRWIKWENDFCIARNIRKDSNTFDAIMFDLMSSDGDVEGFSDVMARGYGKRASAVADAEQQAIEQHSYNIARNTGLGKGFADWLSRPNSVPAMVADLGRKLSLLLKDGKISRQEALKQLNNEKTFNSSYEAFRHDLQLKMDSAWKKFRDGRYNTNISQEQYEQFYDDYKSYRDALENLTKEDYADMLLNQYK